VLAGRQVQFNNQYLNNFYLISGNTGVVKKTTSQTQAMVFLKAVKKRLPHLTFKQSENLDEQIHLTGPLTAYPISTHFSVEGLQSHAIGEGTSTAIQMGEYGSLFEVGKRQGQGNTISELTNMYDGNSIDVKTVSRQMEAENFSLSILAASTPSWLGDFCSNHNVSGGFVNRHLVFTGNAERILPSPEYPPDRVVEKFVSHFVDLVPKGLHHDIENGRIKWRGDKKIITWPTDVELFWYSYYRARVLEMRALKSTQLSELSARELTHATKLTGLSAFLDKRRVVNAQDLEFGIRLARWSIQNIIGLITTKNSANKFGREAQRVINHLEKNGPTSKTHLARALGGNQTEVNRTIQHLIADEFVEWVELKLQLKISPNSQQGEIEKYFGKFDTSAFNRKNELEVKSGAATADASEKPPESLNRETIQ
jgi:hypothetical protein